MRTRLIYNEDVQDYKQDMEQGLWQNQTETRQV